MGIVSLKVPQGGMIEAIVRLPCPLPGGVCLPPSTYARPSRLPRALGQSSHRADDELGALWLGG